ncbi:MAG: hypothetical protein R3B72_34815 [Polyangiaceae bacterium]
MSSSFVCRAVFVAWALTLGMGHEGGCHGEPGPALPSPVNALGCVVQREDGTLDATLWLRSDTSGSPVALAGASAVELLSDGERVALVAGEAGIYRAEAHPDTTLAATQTLSFDLGREVADDYGVYSGSFSMAMHAPMDRPGGWLEEATGESGVVMWTPALPAVVEVLDTEGAVLWSSLDAWSAVPWWDSLAMPGLEVPLAGAVTIRLCGVESLTRDELRGSPSTQELHLGEDAVVEGQLGSLSGMIVGRCDAFAVASPS